MEWLESAILQHSALQAVIVLSLIVAVGLGLGKIKICGITLGVTWVFFAGILAGHVGLSIDHQMLLYAESFGLVLFVYELGLKVGPGFFSSFRTGGVKLNVLGLTLVMLGTLLAVAMTLGFSIPMADMVGIIAGATTNTPSLGAAQQALQQIGLSANGAALSCAVTYPLGVVGVILAIIVARKLFVRPSDMKRAVSEETNQTYIAAFQVHNPAVYGKTVREAASGADHPLRCAGENRLERRRYRLGCHRFVANIQAYHSDTAGDQRQEARIATAAQQLWNQYIACAAFGCDAARHA